MRRFKQIGVAIDNGRAQYVALAEDYTAWVLREFESDWYRLPDLPQGDVYDSMPINALVVDNDSAPRPDVGVEGE